MSNDQNSFAKSGEEGIPLAAGIITVISYLALHMIWSRNVFGPYAFVYERVIFLTAVLLYFKAVQHLPLHQIVGHFRLPLGKDRSLFFLILAAALVFRLMFKIGTDGDTWSLTIEHFLADCVIAPVNEELVFRGIVMLSLASAFRQRGWQLVALSAVVFAACHFPTRAVSLMALLIGGTLYGVLFLRTRSVTGCMTVHAVWNVIVFT